MLWLTCAVNLVGAPVRVCDPSFLPRSKIITRILAFKTLMSQMFLVQAAAAIEHVQIVSPPQGCSAAFLPNHCRKRRQWVRGPPSFVGSYVDYGLLVEGRFFPDGKVFPRWGAGLLLPITSVCWGSRRPSEPPLISPTKLNNFEKTPLEVLGWVLDTQLTVTMTERK